MSPRKARICSTIAFYLTGALAIPSTAQVPCLTPSPGLPVTLQFTQQGPKLVGNGVAPESFVNQGTAVAVSADGNTVVIGGPGDGDIGAVWVFTRENGIWSQQGAKLVGTGAVLAYMPSAVGRPIVEQGQSVAISADGNTVLVGGPLDNGGIGAAWIFVRTNGTWSQQGDKLADTGLNPNVSMGASVALSADGNTALIGEPFSGISGVAWIYTRSNGVWNQQGKLAGSGGVGYSAQGSSVALSGDGNTAATGGPTDNNFSGATWVFARSGGVWTQQGPKLVGSGAVGGNAYGWGNQGNSVALSSDGNTLLVGGPFDTDSPKGAAWVFTRSNGVWSQQGDKLAGTGVSSPYFQGSAVALSGDGNIALLAASEGAVWTFVRIDGTWFQESKLTGTSVVGQSPADFVALSADGSTAIVGTPGTLAIGGALVFVQQPYSVSLTHKGSFTAGQTGATYTATVQDSGVASASDSFTLTLSLPTGLTATDIKGAGCDCSLANLTCTRSGSPPAGANYPPVFLTVNVAAAAGSQVVPGAALLHGCLSVASASGPTTIFAPFTDVNPLGAFSPAITLAREYGTTSGCLASPPMFCPTDNLTRGQMAVFAARSIMGGDGFTYSAVPYFTDVPASHPYFQWIQKLGDLGVTSGCTAATYCPSDPVTRGQMAVFVIRARLGASTAFAYPQLPYFADVPASHPFFAWIQKMKQIGITADNGAGTIGPTTWSRASRWRCGSCRAHSTSCCRRTRRP